MLPPVPMPQLRPRVKTDVAKNRGLKDIISPTTKALEVISVQKVEYGIHNTQAVVLVEENGIQEERVLIYNRVDIRAAISQFSGPIPDLQFVLDELNQQGYDVTEDDIEIVNDYVVVKDTSLGYYEGDVEVTACQSHHFFNVELYDDIGNSRNTMINAILDSCTNLTSPTNPNLSFNAVTQHYSPTGLYEFTRVIISITDEARGSAPGQTVQFTLPRIGDVCDNWEEIQPGEGIGDYDVIMTFGPDDNRTLTRCIIPFNAET